VGFSLLCGHWQVYQRTMRAIPCPVSFEDLRRLVHDEKLTDEAVAARLGHAATAKRVQAWRRHFCIEALSRTLRNDVPPIDGQLRSLLIGSMLGDGRLSCTVNASRYMENHADDQREYLAWKVAQWGSWVQEPMKPVVWEKAAGDFHGWRFHTVSHPSLNDFHALFYPTEGPKQLDRRVIDLVDAYALSVWFMDDGSHGWWPRITFGMPPESRTIAEDIFAKFSLTPRWENHKGNTGSWYFYGEDQAHLFISLVKPHMPECMAHKLEFGFQGPHYRVRRALSESILRDYASRGVPIRRMAEELGPAPTTIASYLHDLGIHHPRKVGRPKRVST
jgi:hypothetical protein